MYEYDWHGWTAETDNDNDDDREGVYYLTITEGGEEIATIMHRVCGGKYPLDGVVAQQKCADADQIVNALRGAAGQHACAECGKTGAGTFVVTVLNTLDPQARTEVCDDCHRAVSDAHVVIAGSPVDGVQIYGPFASVDEVNAWADHESFGGDSWWVAKLQAPA